MKLIFSFLLLVSFSAYGMNFKSLEGKRQLFDGKTIIFSGFIKKIKHIENKNNEKSQIKFFDLYSKYLMNLEFNEVINGKRINSKFHCAHMEYATIRGKFIASKSKNTVGRIIVDKKSPIKCEKDNNYKSINKTKTVDDLKNSTFKEAISLIKVKGYINKLKTNYISNKEEAKFRLIDDKDSKFYLSVHLGIKYNDDIVNKLSCGEGNMIEISGYFTKNNSKYSNEVGKLNSLTHSHLVCKKSKLELSAKEKEKLKKQSVTEKNSKLKTIFIKYKKEFKNKVINYQKLDMMIKAMVNICKEGGNKNLIMTCLKVDAYLKTMDQRDRISFKIRNFFSNVKDKSVLYTYDPKKENKLTEVIKQFYPDISSYIIGVPARCFKGTYNPSNPKYPYSELKISKRTKEFITPILAKFNDPKLKCRSFIESVFLIGNMDNDDKLDVLRIDSKKEKYLKVLSSDI